MNEIDDKHTANIAAHYAHAKEKHPHFADELIGEYQRTYATEHLERMRQLIRIDGVYASDVLDCELAEVYEAYAAGRYADAIEECYDSVAVLLRMAEMIAAEGEAAR